MPQRALVVGATSAIGEATALELAALGFDLVIWGRDEQRLTSVGTAIRELGRAVTTHAVELTDSAQLRHAVADVGPLTCVVYAAGVFDWATADEADVDAWEHLLAVNLVAAASVTRLTLPALIASAPSALVYIGSASGRQAFANNAAYVASKHGLRGLAEATFLDVRDRGVKVSSIMPGLVAAGAGLRSPAGRTTPELLLSPADVAAAVRFVVTFPVHACPTEIVLQPQASPS